MPKSKSTRTDHTKRAPRDPAPEREEQRHIVGDGVVIDEMEELDTDKYEPPPRAAHSGAHGSAS